MTFPLPSPHFTCVCFSNMHVLGHYVTFVILHFSVWHHLYCLPFPFSDIIFVGCLFHSQTSSLLAVFFFLRPDLCWLSFSFSDLIFIGCRFLSSTSSLLAVFSVICPAGFFVWCLFPSLTLFLSDLICTVLALFLCLTSSLLALLYFSVWHHLCYLYCISLPDIIFVISTVFLCMTSSLLALLYFSAWHHLC